MSCVVCGCNKHTLMFEVGDYTIVECVDCGHGFVEQMPSEEQLDALYSDTAESFLGSGFAGPMAAYLGDDDERYFAFYADRLDAVARAEAAPTTAILDFGCAQGALVTTLERRGFRNVIGFDRSDSAVEEGRDRWKIDLRSGDFSAFVSDHASSFDIVLVTNVLEHVPDPRALLVDLHRLLAVSGMLLVSVPNTGSLQVKIARTRSPVIDPPHHLQYYSPSSLSRLVSSTGFDLREVETEFWSPASDLYLHMKGVPLTLARALRHAMAVPGLPINKRKLGGVIAIMAQKHEIDSPIDRML